VRLNDLTRSTFFRFAVALTTAFLAAYLVAGMIAFRFIHVDLENRVSDAAELTLEQFEDTYQESGRSELISAVEQRAAMANPEDNFYWLGSEDGSKVAGHDISGAAELKSGETAGQMLGVDEHDRYYVAVRTMGDLHLVVGQSFEESDEIGQAIIGAFIVATGLIISLAGVTAVLLASRNQRRLGEISKTLHKVANGEMGARVSVTGPGDDLDHLSAQMNDALGQLQRNVDAIKRVSVDIAHDLRTPINRLGIQLEQALIEAGDAPNLEFRLEAATLEVHQIAKTFDALLRIAQIEAGARKGRFQVIALPEIANAIYQAYRPVAEEAGQTLDLKIRLGGGEQVHGDRDLLTQLLANLIENSIRHCPKRTLICIEVGPSLKGVWMSVSDNGPGIPEDEIEAVTQRFYRLDKSRQTAGSGLGLAIVKAISNLHGANLILTNNRPGLIARIEFTPLAGALPKS
jgi:signal transduction histidine kinase